MQRLFVIKEIFPLRDRNYTDRQGQPQVFTSQGFVLTDGLNTIYGETTGNHAKAVLALGLEAGMAVSVQLEVSARSWQTQDGETRWENQVRILNISKFGGN